MWSDGEDILPSFYFIYFLRQTIWRHNGYEQAWNSAGKRGSLLDFLFLFVRPINFKMASLPKKIFGGLLGYTMAFHQVVTQVVTQRAQAFKKKSCTWCSNEGVIFFPLWTSFLITDAVWNGKGCYGNASLLIFFGLLHWGGKCSCHDNIFHILLVCCGSQQRKWRSNS